MSEQKPQRPLICKGTVLKWGEGKLEVLRIGRVFVQCSIVDDGMIPPELYSGGSTVNILRRELESATVLTEESESP